MSPVGGPWFRSVHCESDRFGNRRPLGASGVGGRGVQAQVGRNPSQVGHRGPGGWRPFERKVCGPAGLDLGVPDILLGDLLIRAELGFNGVGGLQVGQTQRVTTRQFGHPAVVIPSDVTAPILEVCEVGVGEHFPVLLVAAEEGTCTRRWTSPASAHSRLADGPSGL